MSLTSAAVMIGDSGFLNPPPPMAVSCSKGSKYVSIRSFRSCTSISSAKRKSSSAPLKVEEKLDMSKLSACVTVLRGTSVRKFT